MTQQCVNCPGAEDHSTAQCPVMAEASAVVNQQVTAADSLPVGVPDGYMPIPTAEQIADALESVRCFHDMSAELIAPELLANLLATPTVKESLSVAPSLPAAGSVVEDGPDITTKHGYPAYSVAQHERIVAARDAAIEEWSGTAVQNGMEVDRLSAELVAVVGVLSAVQEQFNRYGERFPDGFDSRVFRWVDDAMAGHALSAQQSAPPEFCCKHSYKVAKQAAWGARDLTQCKCDHNEYCEHCWPDDFREGGKWHGGFETKQSAHVSVPRELLERVCWPVVSGSDRYTHSEAVAELRALLNGGEA